MVELWGDPTKLRGAQLFTASGSRASYAKSEAYCGGMGLFEGFVFLLVLLKYKFV